MPLSLHEGWKYRVKTCILHSPSTLKHVLGVPNHTRTLQQKHDFFFGPPPLDITSNFAFFGQFLGFGQFWHFSWNLKTKYGWGSKFENILKLLHCQSVSLPKAEFSIQVIAKFKIIENNPKVHLLHRFVEKKAGEDKLLVGGVDTVCRVLGSRPF